MQPRMDTWPGQDSAAAADGAAGLAAVLDAAPTVTAGLLAWCEARGIGTGPIRVLARSGGPAPAALARLLDATGEATLFRRVTLGRGTIALATAENLFLPARLTPPMRQALAETDTPFGAVLAPLAPARRTIARSLARTDGAVLAQTALVLGADGTILAAVRERFLPALLSG
jgi:chorismate-pyruvate lyase